MKVGIIGSGQIAGIHGPLILKQPNTQIVGIADKDIVRARVLAGKLNVKPVYEDAEQMIRVQKPDVVHILTPPQYHTPLSIMAMNHGCHVLVEKPLAMKMDDAKRMVEAARNNNVRLCVDHNMVFDGLVQRAKELVSSGVIGNVSHVEVYFAYDPKRNAAVLEEGAEYCYWVYRLNGGLLQDLMPHPISLVSEFVPEIEEIQSIGQNHGILPPGWQDEIRVLIKAKGISACIGISLNEKPDAMLLTIRGTKGVIQANLYNNILTVQKRSDLPRAVSRGLSAFQEGFQNLKGALGNIFKVARGRIDKSGGMGPLISKFYEAILTGGDTPISFEKMLAATEMIDRIWPAPLVDVDKRNPIVYASDKKKMAPTVLVTGGAGFIGGHLVKKLLSEGLNVRVLVRQNSIHAGRLRKFDVDVIQGDISDQEMVYEATRGVQAVYHAAASLSSDWDEHFQTNIKGTEYLIDAAIKHKVDRFVFLSTLAVYELLDLRKNETVRENSPYQKNPRSMGPYAFSKIEGEKQVMDAYRSKGLKATIVRPGMVIGPLGRIFFPHFGYHYHDVLFLIIGKGDMILPLTYVDNTVDGIYRASVEDKAIGQAYNLVDDGDITVRDYLERFVQATGIPARIISLPYAVPYLATTAYEVASGFGLLKKGVTSRAQLRWKQARVHFDSTKAKNELKWTPTVSMDEGLNRTFEWYASQHR